MGGGGGVGARRGLGAVGVVWGWGQTGCRHMHAWASAARAWLQQLLSHGGAVCWAAATTRIGFSFCYSIILSPVDGNRTTCRLVPASVQVTAINYLRLLPAMMPVTAVNHREAALQMRSTLQRTAVCFCHHSQGWPHGTPGNRGPCLQLLHAQYGEGVGRG